MLKSLLLRRRFTATVDQMPPRSARSSARAAASAHKNGTKLTRSANQNVGNKTPLKREASSTALDDDDNDDGGAARRRSARKKVKTEDEDDKPVKAEVESDAEHTEATGDDEEDKENLPKSKSQSKSATPKKKTQARLNFTPNSKDNSSSGQGSGLRDKKLKAYFETASKSPFPNFAHPTPEEAKLGHKILASLHGEKIRPKEVVASKTSAGCGDSPSVLDALVRTILSQNTSDANSTRAKKSMDQVYGGSDEWEKIVKGGQPKLQDAIKSGGLSVTKSKNIISILEQAKKKYGKYSLDHLFDKSNEEAMEEMLSFNGVGPKTASCVLLFCLQRDSFAVDTHVWRITGLLGWRPKSASRDETHAHLEVMIPDEDKYGLHILLVTHGKKCDECKAGGKNLGKCELRKAFRHGKLEGDAGEDIKKEEMEEVKKEEEADSE